LFSEYSSLNFKTTIPVLLSTVVLSDELLIGAKTSSTMKYLSNMKIQKPLRFYIEIQQNFIQIRKNFIEDEFYNYSTDVKFLR